jgi:hypothetical protein
MGVHLLLQIVVQEHDLDVHVMDWPVAVRDER